jgi:5-methylthioribose kinase
MQIELPIAENVKIYLKKIGLLNSGEKIIRAEKAGEGNMNVVLRIESDLGKTYIIKQSRPFVQKYPQIPAPEDRILTEIAYYKAIKGNKTLENYSPEILAFDAANFLLIMSDLGHGTDFLSAYTINSRLSLLHLIALMHYLSELHEIDVKLYLPNKEMKILNHEHIFNFPFNKNNGFDLDGIQDGLALIGSTYKNDEVLKSKIAQIGKKYLNQGVSLLHGDFYPGSFLDTKNGLKVIDPEFSFMGDREFDLGVLKAHLMLGKNANSEKFLQNYKLNYDLKLLNKYAGIEILRRILGIAQLPLNLNLTEKANLCYIAKSMILA